jgi:hypothetical protein
MEHTMHLLALMMTPCHSAWTSDGGLPLLNPNPESSQGLSRLAKKKMAWEKRGLVLRFAAPARGLATELSFFNNGKSTFDVFASLTNTGNDTQYVLTYDSPFAPRGIEVNISTIVRGLLCLTRDC